MLRLHRLCVYTCPNPSLPPLLPPAGNDSPIQDNPDLEDYNVGAVIDGFVNRVMDQVKKYPQGGQDATADTLFMLGEWGNGKDEWRLTDDFVLAVFACLGRRVLWELRGHCV